MPLPTNGGDGRVLSPGDSRQAPIAIGALSHATSLMTNSEVHLRGLVMDQRLGENIVIRDSSGMIRAETTERISLPPQTLVDLWGTPVWDGARFFLRNATFRPVPPASAQTNAQPEVEQKPLELPLLTKAWQVRDLTPERAEWAYPVHLRGVVTYFVPGKRFCIQDDLSGIYISIHGTPPPLKVGDLVEVEGVSDPGGYAPVVISSNITVVGTAPLPEPRPVTVYQLASDQEGSQWVEAVGVVRSLAYTNGEAQLVLNDPTGQLPVGILADAPATNLLDAVIRVRGVSASRANNRRQFTGPSLLCPSLEYVKIEEPGIADPLSLPVRPVVSVSQFRPRLTLERRINIAGVVTLCGPGSWFFIQDAMDGLQVFASDTGGLKAGMRVRVAGYPALGDYGSVLRDAVWRVEGEGSIPRPQRLTIERGVNPQLHGRWVQAEAQLSEHNRVGSTEVLKIQFGSRIIEALCPHTGDVLKALRPGSQLRLTGVYSVLGDEARNPVSFQLLLPDARSVEVLQQPPWWTTQHTLAAVATMAALIAAISLWVVMLRHKVREQTASLREQIAREAALEQQYREIFESASDIIVTHDLDGRVQSLNPEGRRLLGYDAEEAKALTMDQILAPESRQPVRQLRDAQLGDGKVHLSECELQNRKGQRISIEASFRLTLKDGKPQMYQVIARDITQRKQVEETLRDSEARYRRLVDMSPTAIYVECDGRVAFINRAALRLFGASRPDDVLCKPVLDLIHPDCRDRLTARMSTLRTTSAPVPLMDEKYLRLDGSVVDVEVAAGPFTLGQKPAIQVILHDITERKRAEEAQRQSELKLFQSRQMLRTVLDTIPQRVFWKDTNSVYVGCNKALAEDYGFSDPADLIGKTDREVRSPEVAEQNRFDDRHVMETGTPRLNYEEPQAGPDGTQRWLRTSKVPLFDHTGTIIGVLGTYEDITEHKRAEIALAEASTLLEAMLENSPDCIYFKDRQSRFVRSSKSLARRFNAAGPEELKGKTDFDFFHEEHARAAFEDEQEIIRSGQPLIGKPEKERYRDERVTWSLTTKMPWRDKDGNIVGTFGISKDVTEIKQAEQQLAYERELFRTLLENLPDAIYFKDCASRFVRLSRSKVERARQTLIGRYRAEHPDVDLPPHLVSTDSCAAFLIGKTDFDMYAEERARAAFEEEQAIIRTGQPLIGKIEQNAVEGKPAWYLTTKMLWRDTEGHVIGTFGVSRDITPLKQAELELEAAHQRVIETSRLAGMAEVATDVLHNVGNVLNSVNICCSIAMERVTKSHVASLDRVARLLQENRENAGYLQNDPRGKQVPGYLSALALHLTEDQTELAKELKQLQKHIDHIKQVVAMQQSYAKVAGVLEKVSATQLVDDALHINAAALSRHDVQVRCQFQQTPLITTEKHKVLQILVNLIRNAKYAMDDAKRADKLLTIKVGPEGQDQVRIEVIDNGIGIAPENLTRIFSHGFTTRRGGHGFGLHSSALAVRDLGGTLEAASEGTGKGAVFTLVLPHEPHSPASPRA